MGGALTFWWTVRFPTTHRKRLADADLLLRVLSALELRPPLPIRRRRRRQLHGVDVGTARVYSSKVSAVRQSAEHTKQ